MAQTFILDGVMRLENVKKFLCALPLIANGKTKRWKITIAEYREDRSLEQNAALWAVAYPPLMEHMGLSGEKEKEELHEYFCGEYFGWIEYRIFNKKKMRPKRTTTTDEFGKKDILPKPEFCLFYSFIQRRAATHGVYIEDPDPNFKQFEKVAT
jgi:hypothetical protein